MMRAHCGKTHRYLWPGCAYCQLDSVQARLEEADDSIHRAIERAERAEAEAERVDWRCDNCGNAYPDGPGTWRHGFHGPEHKCDGMDAQAGHSSASYVGDDVTRSAIEQLRADLSRTRAELTNIRDALQSLSVPAIDSWDLSYIEAQLDPEDYITLWLASGKSPDVLPDKTKEALLQIRADREIKQANED